MRQIEMPNMTWPECIILHCSMWIWLTSLCCIMHLYLYAILLCMLHVWCNGCFVQYYFNVVYLGMRLLCIRLYCFVRPALGRLQSLDWTQWTGTLDWIQWNDVTTITYYLYMHGMTWRPLPTICRTIYRSIYANNNTYMWKATSTTYKIDEVQFQKYSLRSCVTHGIQGMLGNFCVLV